MKAISEFVVHVFDLIEAEGSALRTAVRAEARRAQLSVTRVAAGGSFLLVAVVLCLAGFGLLGAGLMWWLETLVSRHLAALLSGVVILGAGIGCFAGFMAFAGRRQP